MKLVQYALLSSIFVIVGTGFAQQSQRITLTDAVELALERNTLVIQAHNTVSARQSSVMAAYGNFLPTVGLQGDWSQTRSDFAFINGIEIPGGTSTTRRQYSTGIGANLTLFNGFANTATLNRANAEEASSVYSAKRTEQTVIYQTHQLFLNVVRTYQLLKVNEDNLKRSRRQLERITESNKVGAVALADVYRQRVQVGNDELALIQAQNNYEKSKADLLAHLALDPDKDYEMNLSGIPTNIDTAEFRPVNARYSNFPQLMKEAFANRPDYFASQESRNSTDASLTVARSSYFPTISSSASFGYDNTQLSRLTDNSALSFRLSVNYPIFNGFAREERVELARVARENAREDIKRMERTITVDLKKALLDLEAAEKQVGVTQTSVESADMDRQIAEEKYNLGAGTLLDLLVANANYTTALSNRVNAVINYLLAKKQTEYALGTISR